MRTILPAGFHAPLAVHMLRCDELCLFALKVAVFHFLLSFESSAGIEPLPCWGARDLRSLQVMRLPAEAGL
jgi:hypothetical protein